MRNLYREVSDRILAQLANGTVPWVKPWSATAGHNVPQNATTNRPYSGVNIVLLWNVMHGCGYATPRFLTFKQAQEAGGTVCKGEHGYKIYFVKQLLVKDKNAAETDDPRQISMLREYTVFNVAQCEGLPDKVINGNTAPKVHHNDQRSELIDEFTVATQADIREGTGEAYFTPGADYISLPAFTAFHSAVHYYNTLFHELGHWTGHKSRLDRDLKTRFGAKAYAAEELVVELTAAFLFAEFDIDGDLRHASYIDNWMALMKDDAKAFFTAASKAQAAADYLRGLALAEPDKIAA